MYAAVRAPSTARGQTERGISVVLTSDGVELATREWLVEGQAHGVVVLVHGFAASKDDRNVVGLAERLGERNLDVLSYDARGHGESGGTCTLGDLEARDVAAAVALARSRGTPIVLVGASMGGVAVLRHAARPPRCGRPGRGLYSGRMASTAPTSSGGDRRPDSDQGGKVGVCSTPSGANPPGMECSRAAECARNPRHRATRGCAWLPRSHDPSRAPPWTLAGKSSRPDDSSWFRRWATPSIR